MGSGNVDPQATTDSVEHDEISNKRKLTSDMLHSGTKPPALVAKLRERNKVDVVFTHFNRNQCLN